MDIENFSLCTWMKRSIIQVEGSLSENFFFYFIMDLN